MSRQLISITEAADLAQVTRQTIWRWMSTGKLLQRGIRDGDGGLEKLVKRTDVLALARNRQSRQ